MMEHSSKGNSLKSFPSSLTVFSESLTCLTLNDNELTEIEPALCSLTNLTWLELECNNIKVVPKCISQLEKMEVLFMDENQISVVHRDIAKLTSLFFLNLIGNKLSEELNIETGEIGRYEVVEVEKDREEVAEHILKITKYFVKHDNCERAIITLLLIRRYTDVFGTIPKELILISAKMAYESRDDEIWRF